ncbi:uncharacterized protein LOC119594958 [Penaeus monodon]|uniref:uncharacterized protein LOC119594958 n=1 Tax=Penaeus monodon TaxID=6687 RepID=UPI0018A6E78E|nr:uncharacterized protein LOC119594958 [Penaeus monodon]XP_037800009.1 uncharacterized protein LOC119594958 [Penaeus monodon]XP_037800010.1 uncharacterized protein LOC119594958 [Penaeus monodon]
MQNPAMVASYLRPPCLTSLAASVVARCLTYEDYVECTHYRWDPVMIWQFELPQRKKKNKRCTERSQIFSLNDVSVPVPQPPWKEMRKFRDWWWNTNLLGSLDSSLRNHIVDAFEQLSWTSNTEEEYVLFLLLRLSVDTSIELGADRFDIPSEWCADLAQVITHLGPYPLQKLCVFHDALGLKPVLTSLIQQSPYLQVLKVNQWAVSNDVMMALGNSCNLLTEFVIPCMQPQVFMSDESLFSCFFNGMTREEVLKCWAQGKKPTLSFKHLRYIDILYWKQTERFIQMISVFYPNVRLCGIDDYTVEDEKLDLAQPFLEVGAQVTALRISCRTKNILSERLKCLVDHSSFLRELRIHVDDNFDGADNEHVFEKRLEETGVKLKKLISQMKSFDSLALRPHDGVDITKAVLPTLHSQGNLLTSLHMCYEYALLNTNTLYQIINLCPKLYRLAVSLRFGEIDEASTAYRTVLHSHTSLHTLVVQDISVEEESIQESAFAKIINDLLNAAPNIEMLGFSCLVEKEEEFAVLTSASVRNLHLQFCFELGSLSSVQFFLHSLLPNFHNLKVLSIEIKDGIFQHESFTSVCKTGVRVTRKKPQFFQIPRWDTSNISQNTFALLVM